MVKSHKIRAQERRERQKQQHQKRQMGMYFTQVNPFDQNAFKQWWQAVGDQKHQGVLEPFAGNGNLPKHLYTLGFEGPWYCVDIKKPQQPQYLDAFVLGQSQIPHKVLTVDQVDVLQERGVHFPRNYSVCVTNPPFLAKNSAKRTGLTYQGFKEHQDVYQSALALCLQHCSWVCALVPQSILNAPYFWDRIDTIVLFEKHLFESTDHPVCMVLCKPAATKIDSSMASEEQKPLKRSRGRPRIHAKRPAVAKNVHVHAGAHVHVYVQDTYVGTLGQLWQAHEHWGGKTKVKKNDTQVIFHAQGGQLWIKATDDTQVHNIGLMPLKQQLQMAKSARAGTCVYVKALEGASAEQLEAFCKDFNAHLEHYRAQTHDVFLTPFKGLCATGRWRRRLDFKTARQIILGVLALPSWRGYGWSKVCTPSGQTASECTGQMPCASTGIKGLV